MNQLILMLLLIAAIALLPAWLVGCAALGGALGMWIATCFKPQPQTAPQPTALPANVIRFPNRGRIS